MVVDELKNWIKYAGVLPGLEEAFRFLEEKAKSDLATGMHQIDGERLYAESNRYTTKPIEGARYESHMLHADLQYIVSGQEIIGWVPLSGLPVCSEYNKEWDYLLYEATTEPTLVKVKPGYSCLLLPTDAHMPGKQWDGACEMHKVIVKVHM